MCRSLALCMLGFFPTNFCVPPSVCWVLKAFRLSGVRLYGQLGTEVEKNTPKHPTMRQNIQAWKWCFPYSFVPSNHQVWGGGRYCFFWIYLRNLVRLSFAVYSGCFTFETLCRTLSVWRIVVWLTNFSVSLIVCGWLTFETFGLSLSLWLYL